jgi:hypothetical protein
MASIKWKGITRDVDARGNLLNVMHPDNAFRPPLAVDLDQTHAAFVLHG